MTLALGYGIWIEGFVIIGCAVVAAGGVAIVIQGAAADRTLDFSSLLLGLPLIFALGVAFALRVWISWRAGEFVRSARTELNS